MEIVQPTLQPTLVMAAHLNKGNTPPSGETGPKSPNIAISIAVTG